MKQFVTLIIISVLMIGSFIFVYQTDVYCGNCENRGQECSLNIDCGAYGICRCYVAENHIYGVCVDD